MQLQEMKMNQSCIQQDIAGHTDIKLWRDTPVQHTEIVMMVTWKYQTELTSWEVSPETVDGYQEHKDKRNPIRLML